MMKQTPLPSDPNKPRNLSGVQFKYTAPSRKGFFAYHQIQAIAPEAHVQNKFEGGPLVEQPKAQVVGTIQWHPKTGEVNWVRTHQDYRGLGVASTLWEKAKKLSADTGIREPIHSKHRTDAGEAWAKKVGGTIPKRSPFELP
jgi:GNAT superfamily N-acetyltransferase